MFGPCCLLLSWDFTLVVEIGGDHFDCNALLLKLSCCKYVTWTPPCTCHAYGVGGVAKGMPEAGGSSQQVGLFDNLFNCQTTILSLKAKLAVQVIVSCRAMRNPKLIADLCLSAARV